MEQLTAVVVKCGLTRDSVLWFWSRLVSAALLIVSGIVPLDTYVSPGGKRLLFVSSVVVLFLAGKYDSSPLPGRKP